MPRAGRAPGGDARGREDRGGSGSCRHIPNRAWTWQRPSLWSREPWSWSSTQLLSSCSPGPLSSMTPQSRSWCSPGWLSSMTRPRSPWCSPDWLSSSRNHRPMSAWCRSNPIRPRHARAATTHAFAATNPPTPSSHRRYQRHHCDDTRDRNHPTSCPHQHPPRRSTFSTNIGGLDRVLHQEPQTSNRQRACTAEPPTPDSVTDKEQVIDLTTLVCDRGQP